jgi:hypothetical protein
MQVLLGLTPQAIFEEHNKLWRLTGGLDELPANPDIDMLSTIDDISSRSRSGRLGLQTWRFHNHEGTGVDLWREQNAEDVFFNQPQLLGTHRMNYVSEKRRGGTHATGVPHLYVDKNVSFVVGKTHARGGEGGGGLKSNISLLDSGFLWSKPGFFTAGNCKNIQQLENWKDCCLISPHKSQQFNGFVILQQCRSGILRKYASISPPDAIRVWCQWRHIKRAFTISTCVLFFHRRGGL